MSDFATMMKFLRERENLSQRELASKLNMSPSAIGMYESGKRRPKYEDEETIADFFNVDLNTLRGKRILEDDEAIINTQNFLPPEVWSDDVLRGQLEQFIPMFVKASPSERDYLLRMTRGLIQDS